MVLSIVPASVFAGLTASVTLATGAPTDILPGEVTTLEITLSNNDTAGPITGVAFNNSLPGSDPNRLVMAQADTFECFDPSTGNTTPSAGLSTTIGQQTIALAGAQIPAAVGTTSGYCTILLPVTAGTSDGSPANYNYVILGGAVTGTGPTGAVANTGNVNQSINVTGMNRPTISKSFGSSTVVLGGASTKLTITVSNSNATVDIPNFSITDVFPQDGGDAVIEVATPVVKSATCPGGVDPTFNPVGGADTITASGGTVAAGGSCTIEVDVVARQTAGKYQTNAPNNTINASSQFDNDLGINAAANASANIEARSPLRVSKSFSPNSLAGGQSGVMTITWYNDGDSPLTVESFVDSPMDGFGDVAANLGLKVTGAPTPSCTGTGTAGSFSATTNNVGIQQDAGIASYTTIAAGGSCTITTPFIGQTRVDHTPITYTNTIDPFDVDVGVAAIVSQQSSATILVADTLRVLKQRNTSNPRPGNPVQYVTTVQNWSNAAMSDVLVTDPLENGMTFLTGTIGSIDFTPTLSGTGCDPADLNILNNTGDANANFRIDSIPARISDSTPRACNITFYVMTDVSAANGSSTVNTIPAGNVCTDNGAGICNGGSASSTNSSVNTAVLTLNKSFSPSGPLDEGSIARMTIALANYSANPIINLSISDTFPVDAGDPAAQLRVATPANAATTCGGTVTAAAGSTSLALNGGTVPARGNNGAGSAGTCTVQVDVVGPAGSFNNTATANATQTFADGTTALVGPINDSATLVYNSILSATKSFTPSVVADGGRSTVIVRMANSSPVALPNVQATDTLPSGMTVASPPNAYTTCSGSTTVTAVAGSSSVVLDDATIAGGGNCDLVFDVVASGTSSWVNSIPPGGIITTDTGVKNQSAVSATLTYNAGAALTIAKATNPSTLSFPGQVSRLTVTITNGPQAVTGLGLTDYFTVDGTSGAALNGMQVTPTPVASTTCPGGVVTAVANATQVSLSGASLAGNASCTFSMNVTSTTVGGITNFIPVDAVVTNQGLSNAGQATTSLTTQTSIGVVKQFTPNVIKPGQRSRLRITFYNAASFPASSLSVTDTLPAGVTVPVGPNPVTTCTSATVSTPAADQVQVSGGRLGAASGGTAASCYAEIDVTAAVEGVYVNTIPVGDLTGTVGGSPASNAEETSDTLYVKSPLEIHKAIDGFTLDTAPLPAGFTTGTAAAAPGEAKTLTIRLDNPNATDLTQTTFTDTLPSNLVVATTPNAGTTCAGGVVTVDPSDTSFTVTGATIPAGGNCQVQVDILSNISGLYTNTIPSGTVSTFEGVRNEEPTSARIEVTTPSAVSKQFAPPVIPPGTISRLTIFLENDNESNMTLSAPLVDTLPTSPGVVVVAGTPNPSTTCPGGVGIIAAGAGSATVQINTNTVVPPGGCQVEVDVTAATPGDHNNNIPVGAMQSNFGSNQQPANATLSVSTKGYISGKVFLDNQLVPDGIYNDATATPLPTVAIELHASSTCDDPSPITTHTDARGNFLFSELAAGTYSVCEPTQPAGTLDSYNTPGTIEMIGMSGGTPGSASAPADAPSRITSIVLSQDGGDPDRVSGSPNNNFSEVLPVSVACTVFMDVNNDGIQQGADPGLSGVRIDLAGTDWLGNSVNQNMNTDANGDCSFQGLPPGTYSLSEPTQPAGSNNGITTAGPQVTGGVAGTATGVNTVPSAITGIQLPPGTASIGNDFGEIPNDRSVFGRVFMDLGNDGTPDGGDYGIGSQTIRLTGNDVHGNAVDLSTTTQSDGTFSFIGVPESDGTGYTLTQPSQPGGTLDGITTAGSTGGTASAVNSTPSQIVEFDLSGSNIVSANNLFGEIPAPVPQVSKLSGYVYHDANGNGSKDAGEAGISGVTVTLEKMGEPDVTATTDSDGMYRFTGLTAGYYNLVETHPAGWTDGDESIGSRGGIIVSPDTIRRIYLAGKVYATGYNFGELDGDTPVSSIDLEKTVYQGHGSGAGCATATDSITLISQVKELTPVTFCFTVTNTSANYLTDIVIDDLPLGFTGVTLTPVSAGQPVTLAPGQSVVYFYETELDDSLTNTATARANPVDENGTLLSLPPVEDTDSGVVVSYVFDPPAGYKRVDSANGVVLVWEMLWINSSSSSVAGVKVFDEVPEGTSFASYGQPSGFVQNGVYCEARGGSSTDLCTYELPSVMYPRGRVLWEGSIAADPGADNEQQASNEVVIRFESVIDDPTDNRIIENQADSEWDMDNDGTPDFAVLSDDDTTTPDGDPTAYVPSGVEEMPTGIPTLQEWAMILMVLLLGGLGAWGARRGAARR